MVDRVDMVATLDHSSVERSLQYIEKRVTAMVAHSDKRMQAMGKATKDVASLAREMLKSFEGVDKTSMSPENKKNFEELEKVVHKTALSIDGLVGVLREVENIDVGAGKFETRFKIFDNIKKELASVNFDILIHKLDRAMTGADSVVKEKAMSIKRSIISSMQAFDSKLISGAQLRKEIELAARAFEELNRAAHAGEKVAGQPRALRREDAALQQAQKEGQELQERVAVVLNKIQGDVREKVLVIQEDLGKLLGSGSLSGKQLQSEIDKVRVSLEELAEEARDAGEIVVSGPGRGFTGTKKSFELDNAQILSDKSREQLDRQLDRMLRSADDKMKEGSLKLKGRLDEAFKQDLDADALTASIQKIQVEANKLDKIKPLDVATAEEKAQIEDLAASMLVLNDVVSNVGDNVTDTSKQEIAGANAAAQAAREKAVVEQSGYAAANSRVNKAIRNIKRFATQTNVATEEAKDLATTLDTIAPPKLPKELRLFERAKADAKDLNDQLTVALSSGLDGVTSDAREMKAELKEALDSGDAKILTDEVSRIGDELDEVLDKAKQREQIRFEDTGEGVGVGGRSKDLDERRGKIIAEFKGKELEAQVDRLLQSITPKVQEAAATIKASLGQALANIDTTGAKELQKTIQDLKKDADELQAIKPANIVGAEDAAQARALSTALEELDQIVAKSEGTVTEAGAEKIAEEQKYAQEINDTAQLREQVTAKEVAAVNKIIGNTRKHAKAYKKVEDAQDDVADGIEEIDELVRALEGIDNKIFKQEGLNTYNDLIKDSDKLLKSNNAQVRDLAQQLQSMGKAAKAAFDKGEINAKEFKEEMDKLHGSTSKVAGAFNEKIPSAAGKSQVSMWKLGNAADRVGFRGAGAIVRITDAFRGIPPAALGGVLAIAGIAAAITKLVSLLAELAKKAAKAFADFTKSSVAAAKSVQVTDRQLGALIKRPELGRGFRQLLQEKSFDIGLDLTKDFSRVIVPLTGSIDQLEDAADVAATLAHAFQETEESISNALKQAAGGHFRPLIQRFGITQDEIAMIQRMQEETDNFTGVVDGLKMALDFRGLNLNTFTGTLELLVGQFNVLKDQVQVTFGEPVRDALGEQLQNLFDIVEDRKGPLMDFFEELGNTVAGVIDTIGGVVEDIVGDVTDTDIKRFEGEISELGEAISEAVEEFGKLLSNDDQSLVDTMSNLVDVMTELTIQAAEFLEIVHAIKTLGGITEFDIPFTDNDFGDLIASLKKGGLGGAGAAKFTGIPALWESGKTFLKYSSAAAEGEEITGEEAKEEFLDLVRALPIIGNIASMGAEWKDRSLESKAALEGVTDAQGELNDAVEDGTGPLRDLIDAGLAYGESLVDLEELMISAAEAQEKIDDAQKKFARDRAIAEGNLRTRFARQDVDAETKRSEKREDLFKAHMRRLLQQTDKMNQDVLDTIKDYDRKEEAAEVKLADKLVDIDQEEADKKIDIEKKYRERIEDIRRKFDLDAEEAIRKNDAVALLRLRRKLKADIDQAGVDRKRQEDDAADIGRDKAAEAHKWLERQVRDNNTAEQQKLNDIVASDKLKREELIDQYLWEYGRIDIEHKRQQDARSENLQRALDDMADQYEVRAIDMAKGLEAEYEIVKEWKDKETEYMKTKLQEQANLIQQQYRMWAQEGSLFSQYMTGDPLHPSNFNPYGDIDQDTEYVVENGQVVPAEPVSPYGPYWRPGDPLPRQHGGFVTSGNVYGINERGGETFYSTQAGIIASHNPMMMTPNAGRVSNTTIDNSRSIQAEINALDPDKMSPIDRTMMRHMFTEELLANGI